MKKTVLAFDLGASSGRAVLAQYRNDSLTLREIHRFANEPVSCGGHLYWDVLRLLHEIKTGLQKGFAAGGYDSIGIDTWGVDYGLIGKNGELLGNPHHYRDQRTSGLSRRTEQRISPETLYALTGNQIMDINTAFQLYEDTQARPELLDASGCFLLMPDLLSYLLTGTKSAERTIAGTTQLFSPETGNWSEDAANAFGIPGRLFPPIVEPGSVKGMLSDAICQELGIPSVPVIAVCGHDTQCAAAAVPAVTDEPFAFISCGTWALFGTELPEVIINQKSASLGVSNEVGFGQTVNFLKNITGLWLIQEMRRALCRQGQNCSFTQMEQMARNAEPGVRFIDTDAPAFGIPGDMSARIRAWCIESGQPEPEDPAEAVRCIYDSLACKFRISLEEITACTGQNIRKIYMLGGGTKDPLLCQLTADVCGIPVLTGSGEATAMGNATVQLIASGLLADLAQARQLAANSIPIRQYTPNPENAYIYDNYRQIFKKEV